MSEAQQKIVTWKEQARSITGITPTHDAVLQGTFDDLESFSNQLSVMAKLQSPTLRLKHWRAIFKGQTVCLYTIKILCRTNYNKCIYNLYIYVLQV